VGYAGGTKKNPTYQSLGNHTETIQIDYDPTVISYEKLLDVFLDSHSPDTRSWSRQYMTAIFYQNDEQKRLALLSRDRYKNRTRKKFYTKILPLSEFYLAEDYHQKHRLRSDRDFMRAFSAMYPLQEDFINSTAAARINGYLDGYGSFEDLKNELPGFGLSTAAEKKLVEVVKKRKGKMASMP
jgi:peptide-methionine (S)-S-oxide reductase